MKTRNEHETMATTVTTNGRMWNEDMREANGHYRECIAVVREDDPFAVLTIDMLATELKMLADAMHDAFSEYVLDAYNALNDFQEYDDEELIEHADDCMDDGQREARFIAAAIAQIRIDYFDAMRDAAENAEG